jgi:hypothetical protein
MSQNLVSNIQIFASALIVRQTASPIGGHERIMAQQKAGTSRNIFLVAFDENSWDDSSWFLMRTNVCSHIVVDSPTFLLMTSLIPD